MYLIINDKNEEIFCFFFCIPNQLAVLVSCGIRDKINVHTKIALSFCAQIPWKIISGIFLFFYNMFKDLSMIPGTY